MNELDYSLIKVGNYAEVKGFDYGMRKIRTKYEVKWLLENKDKIISIKEETK